MINGRKILKLNSKYNFLIIKPIITAIIPTRLLRVYHRKKFSVS